MTKKQKPLIARKTSIGILVLIIINIVIAWATIHQRTIWLGHTESSKQNHTVSAEQFKDNLIMNVVYYEPWKDKIKYKKLHFNYTYAAQNNNCYTVSNQQLQIPTLIHRFYALDEQCTLLFRSPLRMQINNVSLICRNDDMME
ncbi:hypothetical protein JCM19237_2381 [Photobacterium aphoticum]|uniref:Uncharacterized protein n=1 Tax=Photobacterium aphoticum TaxID=754436 RepID=A0A090QM54_9GAMM|nr:hypothetical protein JCM19237_2381 [Photobacterium aphoticum]